MPRPDFPPRLPDEPAPGRVADAWKVKFADAMLAAGPDAKRKNEDPKWTVRERLAARLGRLHTMRATWRAAEAAGAPGT